MPDCRSINHERVLRKPFEAAPRAMDAVLTVAARCLRHASAGALWMASWWVLADQIAPAQFAALEPAPVRFVLAFDDGPSGDERDNPTEIVLDALADNPTQHGVKAIFFVLTRSGGGTTARGRALLAREQRDGHLLALHDGSTRGHHSHRKLNDADLEATLRDGVADLRRVTGRPVTLLRPPYWSYDERTQAAYARHGLAMLLTDISANDGKTWGFHASPRRRSHMASALARMREKIMRGEITTVDGVTPIVVTFHDTNAYTAAHMPEYLQMLVEEARSAGIGLSDRPFYGDAAALERAALGRARELAGRSDGVPWPWRWIHWLLGSGPSSPLALARNSAELNRSTSRWLPL